MQNLLIEEKQWGCLIQRQEGERMIEICTNVCSPDVQEGIHRWRWLVSSHNKCTQGVKSNHHLLLALQPPVTMPFPAPSVSFHRKYKWIYKWGERKQKEANKSNSGWWRVSVQYPQNNTQGQKNTSHWRMHTLVKELLHQGQNRCSGSYMVYTGHCTHLTFPFLCCLMDTFLLHKVSNRD